MSEKRQRVQPAPIQWGAQENQLVLKLKLITPLFGGGVKLEESGNAHIKNHDSVTPIRGASIRGQLRFWWRATTGAWYKDLKTLREREAALFGAAANQAGQASVLRVNVDDSLLNRPDRLPVHERRGSNNRIYPRQGYESLAYGAFPLSPARDATDPNPGNLSQFNGSFTLKLTFPKTTPDQQRNYRDELLLAVSAWVAFGGLGGRTSRGFGQLDYAENPNHLLTINQIFERIQQQGEAPLKDQVPSLQPKVLAPDDLCNFYQGGGNASPIKALNQALGNLQKFRQGPNWGRNAGQQRNRPGRSRWPEPDAIRQITKRADQQHQIPLHNPVIQKFPRAAFGLPIIFHFQSGTDPDDTTLQPQGAERMRSPLQIAVDGQGNYFYLILSAPRPQNLELIRRRQVSTSVSHQLTEDERESLAQYSPPRTEEVFNHTDPLKAFLRFVHSQQRTSQRRGAK